MSYFLGPLVDVSTPHGAAVGHKALRYTLNRPGTRTAVVRAHPATRMDSLIGIGQIPGAMLADLRADPELTEVPFTLGHLGERIVDLPREARSSLAAHCERQGWPMGWVHQQSTCEDWLRYMRGLLLASQRLGENFPRASHILPFSVLPDAQRESIYHMLHVHRVGRDINPSATLEHVLYELSRHDRSPSLPEVDVSYSDDFNRASLGANWNQDAGTWSINASTVLYQTNSGSAYYKLRYASAMDTSNYDVQLTVRTNNAGDGGGPSGRLANSATNTYYGWLGFGGDAVYLVEITTGAEGILATGGAMSGAAPVVLRLNLNGTTLSGYIAGAFSVSASDATLTGSTVGIGAFGLMNTANMYMDDWSAADLVSSPYPLPGEGMYQRTQVRM